MQLFFKYFFYDMTLACVVGASSLFVYNYLFNYPHVLPTTLYILLPIFIIYTFSYFEYLSTFTST